MTDPSFHRTVADGEAQPSLADKHDIDALTQVLLHWVFIFVAQQVAGSHEEKRKAVKLRIGLAGPPSRDRRIPG